MSTDVSEVLTTAIIRAKMMEAVSTSETSVNSHQTTRSNISEYSHIHIRCQGDVTSRNGTNVDLFPVLIRVASAWLEYACDVQ